MCGCERSSREEAEEGGFEGGLTGFATLVCAPLLSSSKVLMMLSMEPPPDSTTGSSLHLAASGWAPIAALIPWWVGGGAAVTSSGPRCEIPCILYLVAGEDGIGIHRLFV